MSKILVVKIFAHPYQSCEMRHWFFLMQPATNSKLVSMITFLIPWFLHKLTPLIKAWSSALLFVPTSNFSEKAGLRFAILSWKMTPPPLEPEFPLPETINIKFEPSSWSFMPNHTSRSVSWFLSRHLNILQDMIESSWDLFRNSIYYASNPTPSCKSNTVSRFLGIIHPHFIPSKPESPSDDGRE